MATICHHSSWPGPTLNITADYKGYTSQSNTKLHPGFRNSGPEARMIVLIRSVYSGTEQTVNSRQSMISSWLGLSGPGPALHSADHRERGRCDTKTKTFFFIVHLNSTETFIRSRDKKWPESELVQMTWDQWLLSSVTRLAKHWHRAWPWHQGRLPRTASHPSLSHISITIPDLMNNTPITENNAPSLARHW